MGDRVNVRIHFGNDNWITLYSHWGGHRMARTVAEALKRGKGRWQDPSYLARIIFCKMVFGREEQTTGYGIFPGQPETGPDNPDIVVDTKETTVSIRQDSLSFEDFISKHINIPEAA